MNDGFFTATPSWQRVQLNGEDITNGTFTIDSESKTKVWVFKSDVEPVGLNGTSFIRVDREPSKYDLSVDDFLYVMSKTGNVTISVIPA